MAKARIYSRSFCVFCRRLLSVGDGRVGIGFPQRRLHGQLFYSPYYVKVIAAARVHCCAVIGMVDSAFLVHRGCPPPSFRRMRPRGPLWGHEDRLPSRQRHGRCRFS
jgi:hypothetical protein